MFDSGATSSVSPLLAASGTLRFLEIGEIISSYHMAHLEEGRHRLVCASDLHLIEECLRAIAFLIWTLCCVKL